MKLLYVTSLSGKRINGFMRSAIIAAKELGIEFTMACNMDMAEKENYQQDCEYYGIKAIHVDFDRNPLSAKNKKAHDQLREIIRGGGGYHTVHCNTPIGGVLGRICAREEKVPNVIYQAHGFHFWKGAPLKNWLVYYPVERALAHRTDVLITINREDYERAKTFHLRKGGKLIAHPGVGVEIAAFATVCIDREAKRAELGIKKGQTAFITVGELTEGKNQGILIEAIKKMNTSDAILLIAGNGACKQALQTQIDSLGMQDQVKLLGYRSDVKELLKAADCFVFPSLREGLPSALMEAMAAGLPCIASAIRGNIDALTNSQFLFPPKDSDRLAALMTVMLDVAVRERDAAQNQKKVMKFDIRESIEHYKEIYRNL